MLFVCVGAALFLAEGSGGDGSWGAGNRMVDGGGGAGSWTAGGRLGAREWTLNGSRGAGSWTADAARAKVLFSVKGPWPFGTVHGSFSGFKATIRFDESDLAGSAISASVDAKTVSTGISLRNRDLRSKEEWLDTDKYPVISYKSTKIEKASAGYKAVGELTLKGATRQVEIPFTFAASGNSGVFKGAFTINREDYKVGKPGGSVANTINIELEVPVTK